MTTAHLPSPGFPASRLGLLTAVCLLAGWPGGVNVRSATVLPADQPLTVEELTQAARDPFVIITVTGRDGREEGVGSGFFVSPDGLVATAWHVIGEARPIQVQRTDGRKFEVTGIHAWDRKSDLAILRIEADQLPTLPLGNSDELRQGAGVVALGNPQGLDYSVVQGVVSAMRDTETGQMIQLAIPLEPGNSGGPLLDMRGYVQGILTMKSTASDNLGFAMPVNALKLLLESPNPVSMDRWLTIGRLDPGVWSPMLGARWSQRAGRITVEEAGKGFGGRSLCLYEREQPKVPYEVAVTVKLDDESGAAGLVFASDGRDRHYGFYPSAGRLRLTRFDGPNVYTWHVLEEVSSKDYLPGDWNTLKVRVEKDRIKCFVNDQLVAESTDTALRKGQVGLAKFRETKASYKNFQIGKSLPPSQPDAEVAASIRREIEALTLTGPPSASVVAALQPHGNASQRVLADEAKRLDQRAAQLRRLARAVDQRAVEAAMALQFQGPEQSIDLFHAALLIARLDDPELDVAHYRAQLETMVEEIKQQLTGRENSNGKLAALRKYLFEDGGFHGSRTDYYNPANSYVNQVLDDREGIPITLSVVFMELARRLGIEGVVGIPLPGHFVVQHLPASGPTRLFDVFDGGREINIVEAADLVRMNTGQTLKDSDLLPATRRSIITRMLANLVDVALRKEAFEDAIRYLDLTLVVSPEAGFERWSRAMLRLRTGDNAGAKADCEWLLDHQPANVDLERVLEIYRRL